MPATNDKPADCPSSQEPAADAAAYASFLDAWRSLMALQDIEAMFSFWKMVRDLRSNSDDEVNAQCDFLRVVEGTIMALPAKTARDVYIKIVAADCEPEAAGHPWLDLLVRQANEAVGIGTKVN